jgi:tRNA pseudouridine32 synthase/23S rRNA pseudouridine746 synthase
MQIKEDQCFNNFQLAIDGIEIPTSFTFPFYYEPHQLSILASEQLQAELIKITDWNHDFGVTESEGVDSGKMFGVLVVQKSNGEIGFLKGFSGKLANTPKPKGYVPHIYDLLPGNNFFEVGMQKINTITARIQEIEKHPEFESKKLDLDLLKQRAQIDLESERIRIKEDKALRLAIRKSKMETLSKPDFELVKSELDTESVQKKFYLKHLNLHWEEKIALAMQEVNTFYQEYKDLKKARKQGSIGLQQQIFEHYQFLNADGETLDLMQIFERLGIHLPPAGAGDCAAPKLLQYAFKMGYKPLCMAEFWWGQSPKSEIKKHKNYYPACTGKCQPILGHMLQGLKVDANPMQRLPESSIQIETIYEDDYLVVINKPSGLLSVPGKAVTDSVAMRLKRQFPEATGPLIVHRLDMPTSGIMLIAKSLEVHKSLQQQFMKRTIKKRYEAILEGELKLDKGTIDLPLRVDLDNRPYQLVCFEHGKSARTHFEVISIKENRTRVYFYPVTGRTHQLRMHAAHKDGLNLPIVGDSLYGSKANRLHLHAGYIQFIHPVTRKEVTFEVDAPF